MKILITGGRSEMCQEMVKLYLSQGHSVIVTASSIESKPEVEKIYNELQLVVRVIVFNFSDIDSSKKEIEALLKTGIDSLVLNAWSKVDELKLFHESTDLDIDLELNQNIKANTWLLRETVGSMKDQSFGRILFISSVASIAGANHYGLYCLGKAAIEGLILNIAVDYGKFNILANILRPGIIKTQRTKRFWERDFYEKLASKAIPQKQLGEAKHVAKATLPFLEKDSYITGTSLNVSGGLPLVTNAK